jgi:hypothetical protein
MALAELVMTGVVPAAATTLTLTIKPTRRQSWTVQQVSCEMESAPAGATCALRKNGTLITPLVPTGDAAAGDPPVPLRAGEVMTVKWSGVTAGLLGRIIVLYDDGQG